MFGFLFSLFESFNSFYKELVCFLLTFFNDFVFDFNLFLPSFNISLSFVKYFVVFSIGLLKHFFQLFFFLFCYFKDGFLEFFLLIDQFFLMNLCLRISVLLSLFYLFLLFSHLVLKILLSFFHSIIIFLSNFFLLLFVEFCFLF